MNDKTSTPDEPDGRGSVATGEQAVVPERPSADGTPPGSAAPDGDEDTAPAGSAGSAPAEPGAVSSGPTGPRPPAPAAPVSGAQKSGAGEPGGRESSTRRQSSAGEPGTGESRAPEPGGAPASPAAARPAGSAGGAARTLSPQNPAPQTAGPQKTAAPQPGGPERAASPAAGSGPAGTNGSPAAGERTFEKPAPGTDAPTAQLRLPSPNGSAPVPGAPAEAPVAASPDAGRPVTPPAHPDQSRVNPSPTPSGRPPAPAPGPIPGPGPAAAAPPPWHRVPGQDSEHPGHDADHGGREARDERPAGGLLEDEPTTYLEASGRTGTQTESRPSDSTGGWAAVRSVRNRPPRQAALQLKRLDPWSVLKLALVLAVVLFFIWLVAVGVLYGVLDGMGVWDQLNGTYADLVSGEAPTGSPLISAGRVLRPGGGDRGDQQPAVRRRPDRRRRSSTTSRPTSSAASRSRCPSATEVATCGPLPADLRGGWPVTGGRRRWGNLVSAAGAHSSVG